MFNWLKKKTKTEEPEAFSALKEKFRFENPEFRAKLHANPELFMAYREGYGDGMLAVMKMYEMDPKDLSKMVQDLKR